MHELVTIRRERPEDAAVVRDVIDAAFPHAPGSQRSVESVLVEELRADGDVISELTFVAERGGEVLGQVTCSAGNLSSARAVGIGPIAVRPDVQREGIGSMLMASVIATADQRADDVLVLLGDPDYYGAFGFRPASQVGITPPQDWGDVYFQAKTLRSWRPELAGGFRYAPAFDRLTDSASPPE